MAGEEEVAGLKWISASADNPGFSVYHASPERDPLVQYVIRQKRKTRDFTPIDWKVFVRPDKDQPLRTIYVAEKLAEAKEFVAEWEKVHAQQ